MLKIRISVLFYLTFFITGCFAWPSSEDVDPVDSDTVPSSDLKIAPRGLIQEDTDNFNLQIFLTDGDGALLNFSPIDSFDIETFQDNGSFQLAENARHIPGTTSFDIFQYRAPAIHRIMFNRASGELIELARISIKAKFESTGPSGSFVVGNNEILEFTWSFLDENTGSALELMPFKILSYRMECGPNVFEDSLDVISEQGNSITPLSINIDEIVSKHDISSFPCDVEFSSSYILIDDNDDSKITTLDVSPDIANPRQIGNGQGFNLQIIPHTYNLVIEE